MKYKPTAKFKTLNKSNAHQGLSRDEFNKFMDGKTVDCIPPKRLVSEGYLEKVKVKNGN
ncbi:MAG: hypothetical protein IIA60_07985 [Candidatus Marinimicrobia bacterium]|nr:hypothetical protein [Candidatus Neomarinimicrobiota bacterium]